VLRWIDPRPAALAALSRQRLRAWRTQAQALGRDGLQQIAQDFQILLRASRAALASPLVAWLRLALRAAAAELRALWRDATQAGSEQLSGDSRILIEAAHGWLRRTPAGPAWRRLAAAATPAVEQLRRPLRTAAASTRSFTRDRLWPHVVETGRRIRRELAALASTMRATGQSATARAQEQLKRGLRGAERLAARRPALVRTLVVADMGLAATIVSLVAANAASFQAIWATPARPQTRPVIAAALRKSANEPPTPATLPPTPTSTPSPAPSPSPTYEPVLTATPIPVVYTNWESTLPQYGGWNGAGECWGPVLAPTGSGLFAWPTDRRYLVGKNYNARYHPGLDLGGEVGDPLYAADSGVVVYAGWNVYGYGNLVILDHGNGWHTLYAHLSQINVACGEGITQGSLVGLAGSTGRSTGPHLHFEMRYLGVNVNPWSYLPP